jgi:hypothetical protein
MDLYAFSAINMECEILSADFFTVDDAAERCVEAAGLPAGSIVIG